MYGLGVVIMQLCILRNRPKRYLETVPPKGV